MDIKSFITTSGITQFELAQKCGVTQPLISQWMSGVRRVPAERVLGIERATGGQVSRHDLRPDLYPVEEAA